MSFACACLCRNRTGGAPVRYHLRKKGLHEPEEQDQKDAADRHRPDPDGMILPGRFAPTGAHLRKFRIQFLQQLIGINLWHFFILLLIK